MRKFWDFKQTDTENILRLEGYIASESWFGDEVTPQMFKDELNKYQGDITVWINSPGGDVFSSSQIYNMLMEHKGNVKVKIDGLAASAASVVAMAGTTVEMSPVSYLMIHNPATAVFGEAADLEQCISMLNEVKEGLINAYELKTGMSRLEISNMMDCETWLSARKAVELGFADSIMYNNNEKIEPETDDGFVFNNAFMFDKRTVTASLVNKILKREPPQKPKENKEMMLNQYQKRLELIK